MEDLLLVDPHLPEPNANKEEVEIPRSDRVAELLRSTRGTQITECLMQVQQRQGYKNFVRGVLDGNDQNNAVKCDDDFLGAIMEDLDKLVIAWSECEDEDDTDAWEFIFDPVATEIDRLGENPGLVPDQTTRENFFAYVKTFCSLVQSRPTKDIEETKEAVAEAFESDNQKQFRKDYDPERLPWHQFLHHRSPGTGPDSKDDLSVEAGKIGTRQLIPPGGLRLIDQWERDLHGYAKEVFPDEDPGEAARVIWHPKNEGESAVGGKIRHRRLAPTNFLAHIPKDQKQRVTDGTMSLQDLSQEYGEWDDEDVRVSQVRPAVAPYMRVAECRKAELRKWRGKKP